MKVGWDIHRFVRIGGVSAATVVWAILFYTNYWQADMVAFGDATAQLASLQLVLWKYLAAGAALAGTWVAALRPATHHNTVANTAEHLKVRGH